MTAAAGSEPQILAYLLAHNETSRFTKQTGKSIVDAKGERVEEPKDVDDDNSNANVLRRRDDEGRTAVLWAARSTSVHSIRVLTHYGADLTAVDDRQRSLLHHAVALSPVTYDFCKFVTKNASVSDDACDGILSLQGFSMRGSVRP